MLLVIDVGNTNITFGVFKEEELVARFRMRTQSEKTSDEYGVFIVTVLKEFKIYAREVKDVIISSVVPDIMYSFTNGIRKYLNKEPMIVGPGIKTGISIHTDNPSEVGSDRIVDAVAGYKEYGGPIIIIDFGTATTYDVVTEKGVFEAAITSPGIRIIADSLWKKTAKLPEVEIKKPSSILAKNTITSMQAGLVYGYIGQVKYIIEQIQKEMNMEMKVVATGGLGRIIIDSMDDDLIYDSELTLKGLKYIYEKNAKK
ncbi:type III pantothenate kinase [Vallitaleaceae bacterium 9-2]